jgi:hypothetical protein
MHRSDDQLMNVEGGRYIAASIPDATFLEFS